MRECIVLVYIMADGIMPLMTLCGDDGKKHQTRYGGRKRKSRDIFICTDRCE